MSKAWRKEEAKVAIYLSKAITKNTLDKGYENIQQLAHLKIKWKQNLIKKLIKSLSKKIRSDQYKWALLIKLVKTNKD